MQESHDTLLSKVEHSDIECHLRDNSNDNNSHLRDSDRTLCDNTCILHARSQLNSLCANPHTNTYISMK